jgi:serine/threonine-protein kinase
MGEVYRATNVSLGRKVAIKLLSPEYVNNEDDVNRFLREARAAAAVRHTNVVDVLDVAREDNGTPFIVQELLAGEDLERYLRTRGGRLSPSESLEIMIPVADAVAAAHAQKVVHRDLKPANIFLARDRNQIVPKVLDFGAALFPTIAERSAKEARMLIGTPHYMAPEQIIDKTAVDSRSDVWALGVILYEMMVGETPFEAETAQAVLNKVKTVNVPALRSRVPDAPIELEQVVAKCTNRDRLMRFPDAGAAHVALEAVRKKMKGVPKSTTMATLDDAEPSPMALKPPPRAPSIPDIAPRTGLLTLSNPEDSIPPPSSRRVPSLDLDLPPPKAPSGVRPKIPSFTAEEADLPQEAPGSVMSSLPPVLFGASTSPSSSAPSSSSSPISASMAAMTSRRPEPLDIPPPAPLPADMQLDLSQARPMGPPPVHPTDYAKRVVEQTWTKADTVRLGLVVAIPAIIVFLAAGLLPSVSQPVRHALLGDSSLASGAFAVGALIVAALLCARAALRERTRLSYLAAGAAVLFAIAMIITTFGATETVESGDASTTSLATLIGPLAPFVLSLDWLTKTRDYWLDPYSRSEARRGAAVASIFLFITLALSPVGAVRAPPRPMNAIEAMLKS